MNLSEFQSTFFNITMSGNVCLLKMVHLQLTEDENLEQLEEDFVSLVDNYQAKKVAVDLSSVRYMTSSAIGKFIALHRRINRNQGAVVLCCLQEDVIGILQTSHLLAYFKVMETPEDAIAELV